MSDQKERKIPRTYTLDPSLLARLKRLAERGQRPINRQLAILLEDAIDRAERSEGKEPGNIAPAHA